MYVPAATAPTAAANAPARSLPQLVLIGLLPLTDLLQTGIVAFNAAPIAGDIGASPEEYSLVATLYAVVAVGMIFHHRWLVERLGWRLFLGGSCVLFAAGAAGCALAETLAGFASARVVMATGAASFFTAGRVLVNRIPPSPRRFVGVRFFASGVAWGGVLGPLVASLAYSHGTWRGAFVVLLAPALVMGILCVMVLPAARPEPQSRPHLLALAVLVGGSFLFLHGLQRSNFAFFAEAPVLVPTLVLALPALALFTWLVLRHESPLLQLRAMAKPRLLVGLSVFLVCYIVLGANNTMMPIVLRGLDLSLDVVDRTLAFGALGGVAYLIVAARLLPKHPGPSRYYIAAFGFLGLCGWQLSSLSESAHPFWNVVPALLCNGAFVIAALSTTAIQTFKALPEDETVFSHSNQLKNMLAQLGTAAGTTIAILCLQSRSAVHQTRLGETITSTSAALQTTLDTLTQHFASTVDAAAAPRLALAQVAATLLQEAQLLAALDYFFALAWFAVACLCVVLLERTLRVRAR